MSIETDLRCWSREVLEVPNPHLNGLPACPFARKAWADDKVAVVETDNIYADTVRQCAVFSGSGKDLVVVASYAIPDIDEFNEFVEAANDAFSDVHCMQFHPDYGAEDAELEFLTDNDWESGIEEPYCMVFIQDLRKVVDASDRLELLGYYQSYPDDEYQALVCKRRDRLIGEKNDPD